jgi:hypothetical protein
MKTETHHHIVLVMMDSTQLLITNVNHVDSDVPCVLMKKITVLNVTETEHQFQNVSAQVDITKSILNPIVPLAHQNVLNVHQKTSVLNVPQDIILMETNVFSFVQEPNTVKIPIGHVNHVTTIV